MGNLEKHSPFRTRLGGGGASLRRKPLEASAIRIRRIVAPPTLTQRDRPEVSSDEPIGMRWTLELDKTPVATGCRRVMARLRRGDEEGILSRSGRFGAAREWVEVVSFRKHSLADATGCCSRWQMPVGAPP
jgi:hypothetical protein